MQLRNALRIIEYGQSKLWRLSLEKILAAVRQFVAKSSILLLSRAFKQVKLNSLKLNFLQANLFILTFS